MSNIIKNMTVISKEINFKFESASHAAKTMNTQYDKSYEYEKAAAGSIIKVKQIQRQNIYDGRVITTVSPTEERVVELPRATWRGADIAMNGEELAQDLTKAEAAAAFFGKSRIGAATQSLAAIVDAVTYANLVPKVFNYTRGAATTNPTAYSDIGELKAKLDDYHAPAQDRSLMLTNQSMISLNNATSGFFNPQGKKSDDYMTGELGDVNGFQCYNTTNLPRHTNGTATAGAVKATLNVEGVNQMVVDGLVATTILVGDRFTIADVKRRDYLTREAKGDLQDFVVTAASATAGGEATITFYPAIETLATNPYATVDSFPQENAVVTFAGRRGISQSINLAYQKDAFILAFIDVPRIGGGATEQYIRDAESGLSMKLTGGSDVLAMESTWRLDILFGSCAPNPWFACVQYAA